LKSDAILQSDTTPQSDTISPSDTLFQKRGRDRLSIIALMLEVALEDIPKTQIMQRASLSVLQLYEYLPFLLKRKLLSESEINGRFLYHTTRRGLKFLQLCRELNNLLAIEGAEETYEEPTVVIAIPAFNEEKSIGALVLQARKYAERVIVCDDGSSDLTGEIAAKVGANVIRHERNRGYGAALLSLFERTKEIDADIVVTMDADGQHDPSEIPTLIRPILRGDADITVGSRFLLTSKTKYVPLYTKLGLKAISKMVGIATKKAISDTQSGFRAYNRKALDGLPVSELGMGVNVKILMSGLKSGLKIVEVPTECQKTH